MGRPLGGSSKPRELVKYQEALRKRLAEKAKADRTEEVRKLENQGVKPLGRGAKRR